MQLGVTQIVKRPPERDHHRITVTLTQHAARRRRRGRLAQDIEPEDEVLGAHPVRDSSVLRTPRSLTEPAHQRMSVVRLHGASRDDALTGGEVSGVE